MEVGLSVRDRRGSKRKGWEVGMGMGSGRGQKWEGTGARPSIKALWPTSVPLVSKTESESFSWS